jgi:acyl dehydratase
MTLEAIGGRRYGPYPVRAVAEKVAEYVAATGDDPHRWTEVAPPSYAGALLFAVAPRLLADPEVAASAGAVIHGEQTFAWHRAVPVDGALLVTGRVGRVRERGGTFFVGFDLEITGDDGPLVTGTSLFLMSGDRPPAAAGSEEDEPASGEGSRLGWPPPGDTLARSASRADLVRYAGASLDWNPIHWDHAAAVAAGLPGVVVHGLLQSAWLCQAAGRATDRALVTARFRFRAPLRPAVEVTATGQDTAGGFETSLVTPDGEVVTTGSFGP